MERIARLVKVLFKGNRAVVNQPGPREAREATDGLRYTVMTTVR